jgi:hypothetical protein
MWKMGVRAVYGTIVIDDDVFVTPPAEALIVMGVSADTR